jgi:hypothetical protein
MRRTARLSSLALLFAGAVLSACGGSDNTSSGSSASPPAAAVEATARPQRPVPLLANLTPVPPAAIPGTSAVLGGSDRRTAAALTSLLKGSVLDQPGVAIYVFPIAGAGGSLLVLEMDAAKGASFSGDPLPLSKALVASDAAKNAHLKQVAVNYRATDSQGPYILTMTLPISVVEAFAKGTISQKDAENQTPFEIKRGRP